MTYADFSNFILAYALSAARLSAAFMICPALTDSMISGTARRVAVLAFAALIVPATQSHMPPAGVGTFMLALIALKEVIIGLLIGFFGALPFWVAENVGNLIDNQRGATMGEVYSPLSGTQVSSTGILMTQVVSTLFFVSGAIFVFLGAIYTSYEFFPIFTDAFSLTDAAPTLMLSTLDDLMQAAAVIAAPAVILMFLCTIGLGFVNRTAPQLNVFFLSMPIKSALGIAILIVYLPFVMDKLMYTKDTEILNPVKSVISTSTST